MAGTVPPLHPALTASRVKKPGTVLSFSRPSLMYLFAHCTCADASGRGGASGHHQAHAVERVEVGARFSRVCVSLAHLLPTLTKRILPSAPEYLTSKGWIAPRLVRRLDVRVLSRQICLPLHLFGGSCCLAPFVFFSTVNLPLQLEHSLMHWGYRPRRSLLWIL